MGERQVEPGDIVSDNKPPGRILTAITGVAVIVLVCLHYDWWPSRFGDMAWADPLLFGGTALLVLIVAGTVWAIRTLHFVGQDRRWTWWIMAAPTVVAAAAASALLLPPPSFDDMRPEFERVALDVLASPERSRSNVEIGRFDFRSVRQRSDNAVYFVRADPGMAVSGWVYSPDGTPTASSATHLGGPWYEFLVAWRD
ncbi:DUF1109 family protein [Rhodococcus spongiicola]|uniref:DUF1109 family protein n=1 Tax=Rhodococcus spongiicola TaxID=2487352 RepID=A0A3S3ALS1_9NOCA|nr:DUF1109 family protein [Rhodococcus spongiicola]RVW03677.1 DUF1109 family protein [Rhodococcus spongiicola]